MISVSLVGYAVNSLFIKTVAYSYDKKVVGVDIFIQ